MKRYRYLGSKPKMNPVLFHKRKITKTTMKSQLIKTIYRNTNVFIPVFFVIILLNSSDAKSQIITNNYLPDTSDFANPERGFYHHQETHSTSFSPLSLSTLQSFKTNENISLILRMFYLENFQNSNISAAYLNNIVTDLNIIRQSGIKCIIRFAYTSNSSPPYGDAPKNIVLNHIAQLKPILSANMDIIAFAQIAFVGSWGEWYYSDYFGDGSLGPLTSQNYADRKEVTDSLINAFDRKRFVQIRTPYYKTEMLGITTSDTLSYSNSFGTSDEALIGHHNDCFLTAYDDYGTYTDTSSQKPYLAFETRYLPMGGETCEWFQSIGNCTNAFKELKRMHWTYINRDYNSTVLNQWISQGCFSEIKKKLGYRLVLENSVYNDQIIQGNELTIQLKLFNDGYASVLNKKKVEFILKNTTTQTEYSIWDQLIDPRRWKAGDSITLNKNYGIGSDIINGIYKLYIKIGDESPTINAGSDYAIRFSNQNVWDSPTGYNELGTVNINSNGIPGTSYSGTQWFGSFTTGQLEPIRAQTGYMKLFPNPAKEGTTVIFFSSKTQTCTISAIDLPGKVIYSEVIAANENYNQIFIPLNNEKFLPGIYFISIKSDDCIQNKLLTVLKK